MLQIKILLLNPVVLWKVRHCKYKNGQRLIGSGQEMGDVDLCYSVDVIRITTQHVAAVKQNKLRITLWKRALRDYLNKKL